MSNHKDEYKKVLLEIVGHISYFGGLSYGMYVHKFRDKVESIRDENFQNEVIKIEEGE